MKTDLAARIKSLFFPHRCYICDTVVPYPETVCAACRGEVIDYAAVTGAVCDICGLKLKQCNCRAGRFYEKAVFPLFFTGNTRKSLHRMKFRDRTDTVPAFAKAMADALTARKLTAQIDLLTFIPMSEKKERQRGYNQAELLCREIGVLTEKPVLPLLYLYRDTEIQHDIRDYRLRTGNVLGGYEPLREHLEEIRGKTILVVDDILTSGATLNEAAKTLLIFGADAVFAAAAAAVPKKEKEKEKQNKDKR